MGRSVACHIGRDDPGHQFSGRLPLLVEDMGLIGRLAVFARYGVYVVPMMCIHFDIHRQADTQRMRRELLFRPM